MDFGIAKAVSAASSETLTQTGMMVGTPAYVSPEQAAGELNLDGQSDQYSLACVLYEMLSGERPFVGENASAAGRPLRVGQDCFDRGIGLHGRCRLTYRLDGKYSWFEATVGLDPSAGPRGRARLALIVDGKEHPLSEEKERTVQDAPLSVLLDVRGARELTLVGDFGSLGDVQAQVNWGGARLLK